MSQLERHVYYKGYNDRDNKRLKSSCPYSVSNMKNRSLWLAGWHDSDMNHGVRLTSF